MRAYLISKPGLGIASAHPVTIDDPPLRDGHVLISVRAASINYRDLMILKSAAHPTVRPNCILLSDGCGEVISVGDGVESWKLGDRVAGAFYQTWYSGPFVDRYLPFALGAGVHGMLAEKVVLSASGLVRIPDHLTFEEASTLPCAAVTAWHALNRKGAAFGPGSTVLTLGTGGVSLFALQLAKAAGLKVIAITRSSAKIELLQQLGANYVIDCTDNPNWSAEVKREAENGVDHVIEVVGATFAQSVSALKIGGTISLVGALGGNAAGIDPLALLQRSASLQSIRVGSVMMFEALNRAVSHHKIRPVIDQIFPFDGFVDALRKMESGQQFGKIVIRLP